MTKLNPGDDLRTALTRRQALGGLGLGLAALAMPRWVRAAPPSLFDVSRLPVSRVVDLTIKETELAFGGVRRLAKTINGTVPGPALRFREGDEVLIRVNNQLSEDTSLHWHGLKVPAAMDGVPGVSFAGIKPGETFEYRYRLKQNGTYWYHSHSGLQEPEGMYAPLIIDPAGHDHLHADRDYVILLSEWTPDAPKRVMRNLKSIDGYYNRHKPTLPDFFKALRDAPTAEARQQVFDERMAWLRMRMDPSDITDGPEDTVFLMHGHDAQQGFEALFAKGEQVRLRFINGTALTVLDVRIPGLKMKVVAADGQNVEPVLVDELRIGNGETYDVMVQPPADQPYAIVAEAMARTGLAIGTLTPRTGLRAEVPPLRERPVRTLSDMAGHAGHESHDAVPFKASDRVPEHDDHKPQAPQKRDDDPHAGHAESGASAATGHAHGDMHASAMHPPAMGPTAEGKANGPQAGGHGGHVPVAGEVQGNATPYKKLEYADLRALNPVPAGPTGEALNVKVRLTGVMWRYIWTVNDQKIGEGAPIRLELGQRVRVSMVNETMMEHPMHLHGFFARLENGHGASGPMKHTFIVKPGQTVVIEFVPDSPGTWVFHCHLFFHAMAGMGTSFLVEDNNKKG